MYSTLQHDCVNYEGNSRTQSKLQRKSIYNYKTVDEIRNHYNVDVNKFLRKDESILDSDELILVLNSD